jgi:hypothetical protein
MDIFLTKPVKTIRAISLKRKARAAPENASGTTHALSVHLP